MNVNEVKIAYKRPQDESYKVKIKQSQQADRILRPLFEDAMDLVEESKAIFLTRNNTVLGVMDLSRGSAKACFMSAKNISQGAILANAEAVIIAHNHPSGNQRPSNADIEVTKTVKKALELFEISLLDHLILTSEGYTSLADERLM